MCDFVPHSRRTEKRMKCNYCGKEVGNRFTCPACGRRTNPRYVPARDATVYNEYNKLVDEPNIFFIIIAFLFPIFGILYYFAKVSQFRTKARVYMVSSLAGIAMSVVIFAIAMLALFL